MVSNLLHRLVAYLIICSIFLLSSCSVPKSEGFAIYLTKDDIAPDKMEVLSHVDLTSNPLVSIEDIISYDAHSHVIKLTESAYERITQLEVPSFFTGDDPRNNIVAMNSLDQAEKLINKP